MTHRFEFTDEELDVLAFVLYSEDNNLAMLPPGQFTEQARNVRVVSKLAWDFDQRNRAAGKAREMALQSAVYDLIEPVLISNDEIRMQFDNGIDGIMRAVIKAVRDHDNPPEPVPPLPVEIITDFGDEQFPGEF